MVKPEVIEDFLKEKLIGFLNLSARKLAISMYLIWNLLMRRV